MLIEGPFKIGFLDDPNTTGSELHLDFTDEFRTLPQNQQVAVIKDYIGRLHEKILATPENDNNRQGMLMVQQVAEKLLPHVAEGDIPLNETIVIQLQLGSALGRFIPGNDKVN